MNRFARILRHRWFDETDTRRALDKAALDRLQARVAASERKHSGEIRVCVEAGLPLSYLWRGASARERAIAMFGKLRVWDTERNNGVLIYLLLAEHAIEIVADRSLTHDPRDPRWQAVVQGMREAFRAGRFEEGLNDAVDAIGALLERQHRVAADEPNPNELPDRPHTDSLD